MERAGLLPGVNPVGRHCTCHNVRYREQKPIQLVRGGTESAALLKVILCVLVLNIVVVVKNVDTILKSQEKV